MPTIRINNENFLELENRKINSTDSMNDVLSRLLRGSKEFIIDGKVIEVISDGGTTFTIKPRRNPVSQNIIQD